MLGSRVETAGVDVESDSLVVLVVLAVVVVILLRWISRRGVAGQDRVVRSSTPLFFPYVRAGLGAWSGDLIFTA